MSPLPRAIRRLGSLLGLELLDSDQESLTRFAELVRQWNKKMNLTGAKTPDAIADVMVGDALVAASLEGPEEPWLPLGSRFIDIGAGAGAPALPILLLRPDLHATLVEPIGKRVTFQRMAIGTLGLQERASVLHQRLEPDSDLGRFDVAVSRATFAPSEWLERAPRLAPKALAFGGYTELPERAERERTYSLSSGAPRVLRAYRFS